MIIYVNFIFWVLIFYIIFVCESFFVGVVGMGVDMNGGGGLGWYKCSLSNWSYLMVRSVVRLDSDVMLFENFIYSLNGVVMEEVER